MIVFLGLKVIPSICFTRHLFETVVVLMVVVSNRTTVGVDCIGAGK
jgi:hypothetical protein